SKIEMGFGEMVFALLQSRTVLSNSLIGLSAIKENPAKIMMGLGEIVFALLDGEAELGHSAVYIAKLVESKTEIAMRLRIFAVMCLESFPERIYCFLQLPLAIVDESEVVIG